MKINNIIYIVLFFAGMGLISCDSDFTNPGASTEGDVITSPSGLELLTRGLHRRWSVGRQSPVYTTVTASGFTTGELRLINPGNIDENDLSLGGNSLDGSNGIVSNIWEQALITRKEAQTILDNVDAVVSDAALRGGIRAYASLFSGLANGTLATFFDQVPLESMENATFSSREAALNAAITDLDAAINAIGANPTYKQFDIDALNTAQALKARYHNMLGNHDEAISASSSVDLSSTSTFTYDAVNTNPIAFVSILTNNVFQPIDLTLGLPSGDQPDAADARLAYYFQDVMPAMSDFRAAAFFDESEEGIPVYVPGEMTLIKAEAYARKSDLSNAVSELNKILTKTAGGDAFGIGADLPEYAGAMDQASILDAIYTNRAAEMMMSGLRLEDSRRFGRDNSERNRNFYPYPNSERDNNINTPADPN